jgi:hypothetical protein
MNNIILYTILLIIVMYVSMSNSELFRNVRRQPAATATRAATAPAATAPAATAPAATAPAATAPAATAPAATAPAATAPAATAPAATASVATEPVAIVQTLPAIPTLQFGKSLMYPDIADDGPSISSIPGIKRSIKFNGGLAQSNAPSQIVKTVIPSKYYAGTVINNKYVAGTYINNLPNPKWPGKIKQNLSKIIPEHAHNNDVYKKNEPDAPERVDIPIIINFCRRDGERTGDHTLLNRTFVFPNESFVFYTLTNEPTLPGGTTWC